VAAGRAAPAISRAAVAVAESLGNGGRVVFLGAGTSGRLGVLEAAECPPTFGTRPGQIRGVMAGGRASVFGSPEGAPDPQVQWRREGARGPNRHRHVGKKATKVNPKVGRAPRPPPPQ
jgi:N-acetylmuramic acid 6-phosphate (MurNAc-6-P) etherase